MIPVMGFEQGGIQEPLAHGREFNSALKGIEEIILASRHIRWGEFIEQSGERGAMVSAAVPKGELVNELPVGKDPKALPIRGDPEGMMVGTGEDRIVEQLLGPKVKTAFVHAQRGGDPDVLLIKGVFRRIRLA